VAGIVASALAFGRVTQILKSVSLVLERMGPSPRAFLDQMSHRSLKGAFPDFKHRWTTGEDVSALLLGVREALGRHGTLNSCFIAGMGPGDRDVVNALAGFSRELGGGSGACDYLLPSPEKGSACKRLNLFLRWMVRSDDVDPGGWAGVPPAALLIPLDTHMYRVGTELGFTQRKQPGLRAALEITDGFRSMAPDDPVRYDFSLTRLGMRGGGALEEFLDTVVDRGADPPASRDRRYAAGGGPRAEPYAGRRTEEEIMPDIKGSRTEKNLTTAFAGESQARNRYTYFSDKAREEGLVQIADIFEETANQEREHAKRYFSFLTGGTAQVDFEFPAGIVGTTAENLKAAAAGEHFEWTEMYKGYAERAREEGFGAVAKAFDNIRVAEKQHEKRYLGLLANVEAGTVFKKDKPVVWRCRNCGYLHEGAEAPAACPACAKPQAYYEILAENW